MSNLNRLSWVRPSNVSAGIFNPEKNSKHVMLKQGIGCMSNDSLREHIQSGFLKTYNQEAWELQVESVLSLARGQPTSLLAGTGYGKTQIAEEYWSLFKSSDQGIVIVLNPLDVLGDNQVRRFLFK